jgi:hypothetical protein
VLGTPALVLGVFLLPEVVERFPGAKKQLLFDGHGSHLTYDFLQYCGLNYIIPYCFLPHTTHLIQPLGSQPFQVYKHYYRKRNNHLAQAGEEMEDKDGFLREISSIRAKAFKQRTVRGAFRK